MTISVPAGTFGLGAGRRAAAQARGRRQLARRASLAVGPGTAGLLGVSASPGSRLRRRSAGAGALPALLGAWRGAASAGLALGRDHADRRVDRDVVGAVGDQDRAQRPLVDRLHLHGRLVGLDLGQHVAGLDRVAVLLDPFGELALLHRGRQRRHQYVGCHRLRP